MISTLRMKYFRSHKNVSFNFSEKTNIILGKNGSGKTNIIEAILVLATGKSYRAKDTYLIQNTSDTSLIEGFFDGKKRTITINTTQPKKITINNNTFSRMSFNNTIPVVLFEPDFMQIIARGPDTRRDYFDTILSKTTPNYQTKINTYKRIITQRNNLLKRQTFSRDEMFVWNIKISELGGQIALHRIQLLQEINKLISEIYTNLADEKSDIEVLYVTKNNPENYSESLLKGLEKNIKLDQLTGFTSLGAHRDDFDFIINKKQASLSASRGENRTLLLALKIIETKLVEKAREIPPILLLDDVFSELDNDRQRKLVDFLYEKQVIITTTTITPLMKGVDGKIIEI